MSTWLCTPEAGLLGQILVCWSFAAHSLEGDEPTSLGPAEVALCHTCSESVATLRRFVDTRSAAGWGAVANAFAAGLRQLLSEWALFTAQLEHRALCGALPLQVVRI